MKRLFTGLRGRPPAGRYDAVVIGAGVGGLVCANLLARNGLRVLLVEQHYMAGGYCSTFRRKGYTFDAATHFYPLLGNSATLTGRLLADLGVGTDAWIKMDPVDQFHCPDGFRFAVPADLGRYRAALDAAFPSERDGLERFFEDVHQAYLAGLLYYFRGRDSDRLDPYRRLTLRDAVGRHIRDRRLRLLLTADCGHWGSPPSRISFVFDAMLRLAYFLGNYYPRGGSQAFADALAASFEARGGDILMQARVTRIFVERGRAAGVAIDSDRPGARLTSRVRADVIVSNADLVHTLERLLPDEPSVAVQRDRARRLRPSLPCFLLHVGVSGLATTSLAAAHGYHWSSWDSDDVATHAFKIFVPTLYEPAMAPAGGHVVVVQKLTTGAANKAAVEAAVLRRLEEILPGFARAIVTCQSASAQTSERFTLNRHGAMLGWEMSPDQLGEARPSIEGPLRGLYFVGHWVQPGGGVTPVIVSALRAADEIVHGARSRGAPVTAQLP